MKLVVSYAHGEYEDYYKETLCVEHASVESWLAAFVDAFHAWAEKHKRYSQLFDTMMHSYEVDDPIAWEVHEQAYSEYAASNDTWSIVVDGRAFDSFADWVDDNGTYQITKLPQCARQTHGLKKIERGWLNNAVSRYCIRYNDQYGNTSCCHRVYIRSTLHSNALYRTRSSQLCAAAIPTAAKMTTVVDYVVASSAYSYMLRNEVLAYTKQGYTPIGGVATDKGEFYQAMVKYGMNNEIVITP